ncbi:MAG: hypothetical protein SFY67_15450 [Candidatus Melainabacteria bacterium]|nr:hypothetical protein [Candidatus Melainabacteria bacterium]
MNTAKSSILNLLANQWLHLVILVLVVFICYGRTLGSYFLADDFGEIRYVAKIAEGDWGRFWSNFTGNFMQIHTMAVYRPWLLITLVVDYFIWGTNAFGYYLSNCVHYLICVGFIYWLVMRLTDYWGLNRSSFCAFFSALIFALNPLHPESVSWVVGRVDIVCLAYFLASLLSLHFWLKATENKKLSGITFALSCMCFWIAIFTKEMAIGLPVLAVAMTFLWGNNSQLKRIVITFGGFTVLYFIIRYLALGTIGGGYTGSIGSNQLADLISKWTDTGTLSRIFFPIKVSYGNSLESIRGMLQFVYCAILFLCAMRLFLLSWPRKWMLFLVLWLGVTLVPIYQLYGLGFDLEGARFLFFATVPLSILAPVLIFAPIKTENAKHELLVLNKRIAAGGLLVLTLLVVFYGQLAYKNNRSWINAGAQTRAVGVETKALAQKTEPGRRVCVMGTPTEREGAHMILNAISLLFYLEPPFSKDLENRVCSFGSKYYGDDNKLDLGFFRYAAAQGYPFYKWSWNEKKWLPVKVSVPADSQALRNLTASLALSVDNDVELSLSSLNIVPSNYDFLDIALSPTQLSEIYAPGKPPVELAFKGKEVKDLVKLKISDFVCLKEKLRIPLSGYWQWQACGNIEQIFIDLPLHHVDAAKVDLLSYKQGAPLVEMKESQTGKNLSWTDYGSHFVHKGTKYQVLVDVSGIDSGAKEKAQPLSVEVQVTKPNYFFENSTGVQSAESMVESRLKGVVRDDKCVVELPDSLLEASGYRQLRVRALDAQGQAIEAYSYPLTLEIIASESKARR